MRTGIITGVNADGSTVLVYGEAPYTDARSLADKLSVEPPKGISNIVLWRSDGPSKTIRPVPHTVAPLAPKAERIADANTTKVKPKGK